MSGLFVTIHYHGTPITPQSIFNECAGRCFCVSFADPRQVEAAHKNGQAVMLDPGAFSVWRRGHKINAAAYYKWCDKWLDCPTTWAIPIDIIEGGEEDNDALLKQWPWGKRQAAPVWHMNEDPARLYRLIDEGWSRVCVGSTDEYGIIGSDAWALRMDPIWSHMMQMYGRPPFLHQLRGMALLGRRWPYQSVDSANIARNHHKGSAIEMVARLDARQCDMLYKAPSPGLFI